MSKKASTYIVGYKDRNSDKVSTARVYASSALIAENQFKRLKKGKDKIVVRTRKAPYQD